METNLPASPHKRRLSLQKRNTLIAYSFLAPNFLGFIIITMLPVIFSVVLSFLHWNGGTIDKISWAGVSNFQTIFKNFDFNRSDLGITLKNTVLYTLATVPLTIVFSLSFAMLLNKAVRAAKFLRVIYFFPY
ncbi:MAG: sugar ABC transporter permease, partial [Firmicutes bacterium]|nr:sugar ABC transporter permease [Bacillota bacterium]